jgi:CRP-like cAMP-binding protein
LPLENYRKFAIEYENKMTDEKYNYLKKHVYFELIEKDKLINLAKLSNKIHFNKSSVIIEENVYHNSIYLIINGEVQCSKQNVIINEFYNEEIFGEISLFNQIESLYTYKAKEDSILIEIKYEDLLNLFEEDTLLILIKNILKSSIKNNKLFSKYINDKNFEKVFKTFELKFYYNDIVLDKKQKYIFVLIAGTALKYKDSIKNQNVFELINNNKSKLLEKGKLYTEYISANIPVNYNIISDEAIILICEWRKLINILTYNNPIFNKDFTILEATMLLRKEQIFKVLSPYKMFEIINQMKYIEFKKDTKIIKNGPLSNKYYFILEGEVKMYINKVVVKIYQKFQGFGDITSTDSYNTNAYIISSSNIVKCLYLLKETYEEVCDKNNLVLLPIKKIMTIADPTLNLGDLFYVKELGFGSYGKVFLVHNKKKLYAIKTAKIAKMYNNLNLMQKYLDEKRIMSTFNHLFICKLYNTFKTNDYLFFLLEFIDGVSLRNYLNVKKKIS